MLEEYFVSLISFSVLASLLLAVSHRMLRGATAFGFGIVVLCVVMLPLVDIIRDFDMDDLFNEVLGDIDYDATDSAIELAFEDGVAEYVSREYGAKRECVSVNADGFDVSSLTARRIYVTLSGSATLLDYKRIEKEIGETFAPGGECEVSLSIG